MNEIDQIRFQQTDQVRKYLHNPIAAYVVPLVQAMVGGFFLAAALAIADYYLIKFDPARVFFITFFTATWYFWNRNMRRWQEWIQDLTIMFSPPDPAPPAPSPAPPTEIWVHRPDGGQNRHSLIATPAELKAIAQAVLMAGKKFTEDDLAGYGKPFSQDRLKAIRKDFADHKFVSWRRGEDDPQGGVDWTEAGIEMLRSYAFDLHSPTLRRK